MTEKEIQCVIGHGMGLANIVIPNTLLVAPGGMYEADLLYITKNNYLYEIEIKVTYQDFWNDFKKRLYHSSPKVRGLYYAMPEELYMQHTDILAHIEQIRPHPGLILCHAKGYSIQKRCQVRRNVSSLSRQEKDNFMRLGCMAWWSRDYARYRHTLQKEM